MGRNLASQVHDQALNDRPLVHPLVGDQSAMAGATGATATLPPARTATPLTSAQDDARDGNDAEALGYERRAGNTVAFLSSLVFHTALLLLLACWVLTAGKPSEGLLLNAEIGTSQSTDLQELQTFELSLDAFALDDQQIDEVSSNDLDLEIDIQSPATQLTGVDPASSMLTSVAAAGSVNAVIESLKPISEGRGASFFGAYAEGNRFIYVLDSSRSMLGDRWIYACTQLIDSLNGLNEDQEFYVICFDFETTFLFNQTPANAKFYPANDDSIDDVQTWLRSRVLGPATMPAQALKFALDFNPDAIFLLSDGELQDNSRMMLRSMNSRTSELRQIPIHTVHLFSAQGKETLRAIARENKGSFTPIEGNRGFGFFRSR
ncbi:MAG: hypothetical protein AB8B50_05760 [Pirellulaceae bacterium]